MTEKGGLIVFLNGKFIPESRAKVSVMTHTLNYGTGIFEGIRGWWNKEEQIIFVFALEVHLRRFLNSCKVLKITLPYILAELQEIVISLLVQNGFKQHVYIRPLAFKGDRKIGVKLSGIGDCIAIFATPFGSYYPDETNVSAMVSSWRRISDNAIPPRIKCCGAYVNSALAKDEALTFGFDEAIVLNEDGRVAEASAANIFIIRDGVLITPPLTANILEGITRKIVIQLAKEELGLNIIEREVDRSELYLSDEVFITGTACNVSAITSIDKIPIGKGTMGPITAKLRNLYLQSCLGKDKKYEHLITRVYLNNEKEPTDTFSNNGYPIRLLGAGE